MAETGPVFEQVNIVVADIDASIAFYRRLGVSIPDGLAEWPAETAPVTLWSKIRMATTSAS
jgi:hypothetical protein